MMQASRWVLIWRSQGKNKFGCRCRPTRGLSFNLAYDRMVFNGLLFICGTFKKGKHPLPAGIFPDPVAVSTKHLGLRLGGTYIIRRETELGARSSAFWS
jgi:hypothetical protein